TGAYPSSPDAVSEKFTGQPRDAESGLDFFEARYMSGSQGRFTGADPDNAGANPSDPQSWRAYSYRLNNPPLYADPAGLAAGGGGRQEAAGLRDPSRPVHRRRQLWGQSMLQVHGGSDCTACEERSWRGQGARQ